MDERRKASLLWGVAGGLAFLVLTQGARLFADLPMGLPRLVPVAVVVGVVTGGLGYIVEGRLARNRQV